VAATSASVSSADIQQLQRELTQLKADLARSEREHNFTKTQLSEVSGSRGRREGGRREEEGGGRREEGGGGREEGGGRRRKEGGGGRRVEGGRRERSRDEQERKARTFVKKRRPREDGSTEQLSTS
jgi:hypothetical protein